MTVNELIIAISIALNAEFGDTYEIHMEEIKQNLKEPCFFIQCPEPITNRSLKNRFKRTNQFVIQYFPKDKNGLQSECNEVAERMIWCLQYITCAGDTLSVMGSDMKHKVVDGVLNFFVNYNGFVVRTEDAESDMSEIVNTLSVKED